MHYVTQFIRLKVQADTNYSIVCAKIHCQAFPVVIRREISVLTVDEYLGADRDTQTRQILMSERPRSIEILIRTPGNIGIEQYPLRPSGPNTDIGRDQFSGVAQDEIKHGVDDEEIGSTDGEIVSARTVREGQ